MATEVERQVDGQDDDDDDEQREDWDATQLQDVRQPHLQGGLRLRRLHSALIQPCHQPSPAEEVDQDQTHQQVVQPGPMNLQQRYTTSQPSGQQLNRNWNMEISESDMADPALDMPTVQLSNRLSSRTLMSQRVCWVRIHRG